MSAFRSIPAFRLLAAFFFVAVSPFAIMALAIDGRDRLRPAEKFFLERIADQIAGAVQGAELLRQTEASQRETEQLAAFTRHINESVELDTVLDAIFQFLEENYGVEAFLQLYHLESQTLRTARIS